MMLSSFIFIPLLAGLLLFFVKQENLVKGISLAVSLAVLAVVLYAISIPAGNAPLSYSRVWLGSLNSNFSLLLDGPAKITTLLTAVSFVLIFLATWKNKYANAHNYYALMLLTMAGLMGVFLSADALLFYFFWELALIPVYFLCSQWGGEKRIAVTFKFFIYTFVGSVLMLIGIIYLYNKTAHHSFAWESFKAVVLTAKEQTYFFLFFFLAFAIKMPLFPFHTWQPDAYETAPTGTTMVLSGVMVKMGLFGVIRWLLPVFPDMSSKMAGCIIVFSIIGILYASLIAIRQDNIKRLIAYSSIAHIGLMSASLFANNSIAYEGVLIQMFNHGINIIGLWIVVDIIEQQTGIRKMSELGGLAHQAPSLTIMLVIVAFANIALPLTNGFIGEFMMFNGLFQYNPWYAVVAGISIILAAVYTLGMIQKVFYGEKSATLQVKDLVPAQWLALACIVVMIFAAGVYPKPLLQLGENALQVVAGSISK
ncbi:MAG TPA: NADH-quinone oxidoreductase subunit M [Phnomibacter sp.]|nr:NADH-quinone oxidoreductase subunit M [Phnomibacter sp.]